MPELKPADPLEASVLFKIRDGKKNVGMRQVTVKEVVNRLIFLDQKSERVMAMVGNLRKGMTYKYNDKLGSKKVIIWVEPIQGEDYGTGKPRIH